MKKLIVFAALVSLVAFAEQWRTDVPTGYFNDPNNWTGGVVAVNGVRGYIQGASTDYTFLFPAEGYEENGYTGLNGFGPATVGNWMTFDVRNTWWRKGAAVYPTDWEAFMLKQGANGHLFNIESVSKVPPARPVFYWSNAVFRFYASSTSVTNILESGFFNFYNPGANGELSENSLIIGSSGSPSKQWTFFRAGSKTVLNHLYLRCASAENIIVYEGGEHQVRGVLSVKSSTGNWATGRLDVAGNTLLGTYGTIYVGATANGNGLMTIKDTATVTMNGNHLYLATTTPSTGIVTVAGSGKLLGLSGNFDIYIGNSLTNRAILNLQDNGTIGILGSGGTVYVGSNHERSCGYLNVDGGVFAATNNVMELRGDTAEVNLNAGTTFFKEIRLTGRVETSLPVVNIRGGDHTIGSSGLNIGNSTNRSAVVAMTGGRLYSTSSHIRIGYGAASSGTNVFRLTAGDVTLNTYGVYVGSSTGSRGRMEFLGGTLTANLLKGGSGAVANGSTGLAELFVDGGTFNYYPSSSTNTIEKIDSAVLGAAGLTYNDGGASTLINQTFTDADGVDGLFTKNGSGRLAIQQNSSHALTVINGGSLALPAGTSQFGRSLALNAVTLEMRTTDTITADTALGGSSVLIKLSDVATVGTYTLFKSTGDLSSFTNNITLLSTSIFRRYAWAIVPVESVNELRLTIEALPDPVAFTWTGAEDMTWGTGGNWASASVPALQDYVTFTGANPGTVSVSSGTSITRVIFDSASAYKLEGGPLTIVEKVQVLSGSHEIATPVSMIDGGRLTIESAGALNVNGAIGGIQSEVAKTGSGSATLTGANTFSGSIFQQGGILALEGAGAFGAAKTATNGLVVTAGTVQYGGDDGTVARGFSLGTGDGLVAVLFNTAKNLTLTGVFNTFSGAWIKRGVGLLSLEPSGGTHKLTAANGASGSNTYPSGDLVFPADGSSPATAFAGLTVAEGTLRLKGSSSTIFNMLNVVAVGARTVGSETANAALEIDGCRVNQGGSGLHFLLGHDMAAGHSNTNPVLRITNGGYLDINGAVLGNGGSQKYVPELTLDGAGTTFSCFFSFSFGSGNVNVYPRIRLTNGARLQSRGQWESWGGAGGAFFKSPMDFIADGGSVLDQYQATGETIFSNYASGALLFRGGSTMRHGRLFFRNYTASGAVELTFDNGVLDPQGVNTSYVCRATQQGVRILDGGLTLNTGDGGFYRCGLPIRGTGNLTKTGTGTAVFGQAIEFQSNGTTNWSTAIPTAQYTGRTLIQQGTVVLVDGGMTTTSKVSVASGALLDLSGLATTLGSVAGGGTITNGTLTAKYEFSQGSLLNLADVSAATVTVDFGRADDDPMAAGKIAVATLSGVAKPTVAGWKTVNAGKSYSAVYSIESDTVYADIKFVGGTRIILR